MININNYIIEKLKINKEIGGADMLLMIPYDDVYDYMLHGRGGHFQKCKNSALQLCYLIPIDKIKELLNDIDKEIRIDHRRYTLLQFAAKDVDKIPTRETDVIPDDVLKRMNTYETD